MNTCEKIQFELSLLEQDQVLSGPLERHLKDCSQCRAFSLLLDKQNQELSDLRRPTPSDWAWLVRNAQIRTAESSSLVTPAPLSNPMAKKARTFGKIAVTVALAAGLLVCATALLPMLRFAGPWNQAQLPGGPDLQAKASTAPAAKVDKKSSGARLSEKGPVGEFDTDQSPVMSRAKLGAEDGVAKREISPAQPSPKGDTQDKIESFQESSRSREVAENKKDALVPAPASGPVLTPGNAPAPGPVALGTPGGPGSSSTSPGTGRAPGMPGVATGGDRNQPTDASGNASSNFARGMAPSRAGGGVYGGGGGLGGGFTGQQGNTQNNAQNGLQNNLPYMQFGQADGQAIQVANVPLTDQADARSIIRGMVPTPEQKVRFTLLLCQQSAADVVNRAQTEMEMANTANLSNSANRMNVAKEDASLKKSAKIESGSIINKEENPLGGGREGLAAGNRSSELLQDKNKMQEQKKTLEQQPAYTVQNNRNFYLTVVPAKNPDDIVKSYEDIVKKDIPALLSGLRSPSNKKELDSLLRFLRDSEKEFSQLAGNLPKQGQWLNQVIELNKKGIALIQAHNP